MLTRINLILLFTLLIANFSFAQGYLFKASTDAREVIVGNTFTLEYELENLEKRSIRMPKFEYFDIVAGPNSSYSLTEINGVRTQKQSISYVLLPKRAGSFVIKAATANFKGKKIRSNLVKVVVLDKKKSSSSVADQDDSENVFVKAEITSDTAFLGQQLVLDYNIYYAVAVENWNQMSEADYNGFYTKSIRVGRSRTEQVVLNNKQYYKQTLKRIALFPQQTGKLKINSSKFRVGISDGQPNRRRSIWASPKVNYKFIDSEEIEVLVNDLPKPAPASFSGAVGKFNAVALVSPANLSTDDALSIVMTISGNGDVKHIRAPELSLDKNLEIYDRKIIDDSAVQKSSQIQSNVKIEYQVLPKKPGRYLIRPEFSYFNPDSLKYITIRTGVYNVVVRQGSQIKSDKALVAESDALSSNLKPLMPSTKLASKKNSFRTSNSFLVLSILPCFLFLGVLVYKRIQLSKGDIDLIAQRQDQASAVAVEKLESAKAFMDAGNNRAFFDEISKAIIGYANDKLQISNADMSKDLVAETLKRKGVDERLVQRLVDLFRKSEMALFAGQVDKDSVQDTYNSAKDIIIQIENSL